MCWLGSSSLRITGCADKEVCRRNRLARIESVGGKRRLVLCHVHLPPLAVLDARPDLRRGLAFSRLLVRIKTLPDAHIAAGRVFAGKAIEQAAVSLTAVAMAITWLLIEDFFDARRHGVSVLHHHSREQRGTQCCGKRPLGRRGMKRGHRLLRRSTLRLARRRALRSD